MSGTQRPLTLAPVHLFRFGAGRDAVVVQARGFGVVIGSPGFLPVWRSLNAVLFRDWPRGRCRALFVGLHGVAWVSLSLPPAARSSVPPVDARSPELPSLRALPSLRVHLTVTPPAPPAEEGLP